MVQVHRTLCTEYEMNSYENHSYRANLHYASPLGHLETDLCCCFQMANQKTASHIYQPTHRTSLHLQVVAAAKVNWQPSQSSSYMQKQKQQGFVVLQYKLHKLALPSLPFAMLALLLPPWAGHTFCSSFWMHNYCYCNLFIHLPHKPTSTVGRRTMHRSTRTPTTTTTTSHPAQTHRKE